MLAAVSSSARGGRSSAAMTGLSLRRCSTRTPVCRVAKPLFYPTAVPSPSPDGTRVTPAPLAAAVRSEIRCSVPVHSEAIRRLGALPSLPVPLAPTPIDAADRLHPGLLIKRDDAIP